MTTKFQDAFSEELWTSTYKDAADSNVDDTFRRVARGIAAAEESDDGKKFWTHRFYDMLSDFKITSGGRIYSNAGTDWKGTTLMNCFAGPRVPWDVDSLDGILSHLISQAQTLKSEGGWGDNFSYIRPRGGFIHGIGVESPGAVKYMELFDRSSDIITSGSGKKSTNKKAKGKIRKGAMMGVLDVWHPDIIEFVTAKQSPGRLSKFNVSVNCTDDFMRKVIDVLYLKEQMEAAPDDRKEEYQELIDASDSWELRFPVTTHPDYKADWQGNIAAWEAAGNPVTVFDTVSATELWNLIMESTYNRAEPGVLFLDRANFYNPLNYLDTIYTTNPCGEQTLPPGGVCDLGSINLTQFIVIEQGRPFFDFYKMKRYIPTLVRFLDNVNDVSEAPLPEYEDSMKHKRRIGIGVLGWASFLLMMKIPFGSAAANQYRDVIMKIIAQEAYKASINLAIEKGPFLYCDPDKHAEAEFVKNLELDDETMRKLRKYGIRNSSLLSIQPTGNTSIFANVVSGGIEPVFNFEYIRTVICNFIPEAIKDLTPKWFEGQWHETDLFKFTKEGDEEILRGVFNNTVYKIDKNRGLTKEVLCEDYGVRWLKKRDEWNPDACWAVHAMSLTAQQHLDDLKGWARWVDSAISKTINIPQDYAFEDFKDIYLDAYQTGWIKGLTTYRAGTMTTVLSVKEEKEGYDEEIIVDDVKLPNSAPAMMKTIRAEGKKWYLTVVYHEDTDRPFALFVKTNAPEKTATTGDAVELMLSLARSKGIPENHVSKVEEKIQGDNNTTKLTRVIGLLLRHGVLVKNICATLDKVEDVFVGSFLFQIKKFLQSYIKEGEPAEGQTCSECGSDKIIFSEGCMKCSQCGNSKCG